MVWKQDLAKLKQAFREAGGPPPSPSQIPKPKPKPADAKDLNDEDALFLAAMGGPAARPSPAPARPSPAPAALAPPVEPELPASFEASLADLKGLKPLAASPLLAAPTAPTTLAAPVRTAPPPPVPVAIPAAAAEGAAAVSAQAPQVEAPQVEAPQVEAPQVEAPQVEAPQMEAPQVEAPQAGPASPRVQPGASTPGGARRIHLAAGMAVEVDAALDLRHHSVPDALGRLKDRIEDGALMGWRTLHVILGEDPALAAALLAFLAEGEPRIGRYAQAPVPMGGSQAWVLYY